MVVFIFCANLLNFAYFIGIFPIFNRLPRFFAFKYRIFL